MRIEISLSVYAELGGDKPFLSMSVRSRKFRIFGLVQAFIDTGSPHTIFSEKEGLRLHFLYRSIKAEKTLGLGGGSITLHPCRRLKVRVRDVNDSFHEFDIDAYFSRATRRDQKSIAEAQGIPNILGVDFLKATGLGFVYNAKERVALLVKE